MRVNPSIFDHHDVLLDDNGAWRHHHIPSSMTELLATVTYRGQVTAAVIRRAYDKQALVCWRIVWPSFLSPQYLSGICYSASASSVMCLDWRHPNYGRLDAAYVSSLICTIFQILPTVIIPLSVCLSLSLSECKCEIRSFSYVAGQRKLWKQNHQHTFKHLRSNGVKNRFSSSWPWPKFSRSKV